MLTNSVSTPPPSQLLQTLIRFDTSNPPGNEAACVSFLDDLLRKGGFETRILAKDLARPNLLARLPGRGDAPPLLLCAHLDVVPAARQQWERPPFSGDLIDGYIWGRGALDMKDGAVMMVTALLRARAEGIVPPGDIILALVSDEERGSDYGARFLVEQHPEQFAGVKYAISEFGGFSFHIGERKFYPIMVAEKQVCWLEATIRGAGGHGSLTGQGGAMPLLTAFLTALEGWRAPIHVTPAARLMIEAVAAELPFVQCQVFRSLLNPLTANAALRILGARLQVFEPLLRNTVNATMIRGGEAVNVLPSEITVSLDGRLLPGFTPDDLLAELRPAVGPAVELEIKNYDPGPPAPNLDLFSTLAALLREADPAGIPVPLLLAGATDGRLFARLGIQTYGWLPTPLPRDFNFTATIHGANERIPMAALDFGCDAMFRLLQRFGA